MGAIDYTYSVLEKITERANQMVSKMDFETVFLVCDTVLEGEKILKVE